MRTSFEKALGCAVATLASLVAFQVPLPDLCAQSPPLFGRPVAIAVDEISETAYVANESLPAITVIDCATWATRLIPVDATGVVDLALVRPSQSLLALRAAPHSIEQIDLPVDPKSEASKAVALPGTPSRIAVSADGRFACVSFTWHRCLCIVPINEAGRLQAVAMKVVPLDFPPKELLALPDERFLVADAFAGRLAVVDAQAAAIESSHDLHWHHIAGLAFDESRQRVMVAHQILNKLAHTSRDDIHWGSLMQNNLSTFPLSALSESGNRLNHRLQSKQLGDVGNGAGDPGGLALSDANFLAVAVSGTNQIALWDERAKSPSFVDVGLRPTKLAFVGSSKLLCLNTLEDTVHVLEAGEIPRLFQKLGVPRMLETAEQRGEVAFYSSQLSHDGWMSCSSCHVDGHSPDRLADTLGDGRLGTPRRIPSLLNAGATEPWGWDGSKATLEVQIQQTLETTMHRDIRARENDSTDDMTAQEIAAYLRALTIPAAPRNSSAAVDRGAAIFRAGGCAKCHDPELHYTTPQTYDVGTADAMGSRLFNPPSLEGLSYRRSYFHDARFRSLDELLPAHPDSTARGTAAEIEDLKEFLLTL